MPKPERLVTFHGIVTRLTDAAVKFEADGVEEAFWLPKSQIREPDPEDFAEGEEEDVTIPEWLAKEKGLE